MRKTPLFLILGIALFLVLSVFNYFHQKQVWKESFHLHVSKRTAYVETYLKLSQTLMKAVPMAEVRDRLDDARKSRQIDFFILQYQGSPVFWGTDDGEYDSINLEYQRTGEMISIAGANFMTVPVGDGYLLTAGVYKNFDLYVDLSMEHARKALIQEIVLFSLLALGIFFYYFRDIFQILSIFGKKSGKRDYRKVKSRSAETDKFVRGLIGYENTVEALISENEAFGKQVLPSLKKEILSGKKPPYDFKCTMVRTDINNFSQIYNQHDVTVLMNTINDFFKEVSHVVSKYGGLIHEFVGDEVLFYFKDEEHENSFLVALSALRDINEIASQFQVQTLKNQGYPFTVKSSLAHGVIRFGPLVNGFSMAGSVLIETVRILSHVVEKDGSVVYFEESHIRKIEPVCHAHSVGRFHLKGFSGEKTLYAYDRHSDLQALLEGLTVQNVQHLLYYRADDHLFQIVRHFRKHQNDIDLEVFFRAMKVLRSFQVTKTNSTPMMELVQWLEQMQEEIIQTSNQRTEKIISAACMLMINFIPKEHFDEKAEQCLNRLSALTDKRILANVIEVLTHFKGDKEAAFVENLLEHEDNRIAANAIVHEGQKDLSSDVIKALKRLLQSEKPQAIASGLFALGELSKHYQTYDSVYYSTQLPFLKLVNRLPEYISNPQVEVRKQALIAAQKVHDEKLNARIFELIDNDPSGELEKLALNYFVSSKLLKKEKPSKAG